jgi:hypothetical protein
MLAREGNNRAYTADSTRIDPRFRDPDAVITAGRSLSLHEISRTYNVHQISPREMVDLSFDLYFAGYLPRDQYAHLAFQSELMPNFDDTIGALTGEKARPDRARDYTKVWRQRLKFETEHKSDDPRIIERTRLILELLYSIEQIPDLPAELDDGEEPEPVSSAFKLPALSLRAKNYSI